MEGGEEGAVAGGAGGEGVVWERVDVVVELVSSLVEVMELEVKEVSNEIVIMDTSWVMESDVLVGCCCVEEVGGVGGVSLIDDEDVVASSVGEDVIASSVDEEEVVSAASVDEEVVGVGVGVGLGVGVGAGFGVGFGGSLVVRSAGRYTNCTPGTIKPAATTDTVIPSVGKSVGTVAISTDGDPVQSRAVKLPVVMVV